MEQPPIRGLILRLEKAFIKDMSNLCSLCFSLSSKLSMHFMIKFFCIIIQKQIHTINPIPAGVLENQDTLGGGQFDPPPLNPMFYVQI